MGERNAEIALLEQQLNALQIQLDNALDLINVQQAQQAQPAAMEVDKEEDPEEIQGVSEVDTEFPCHHLRELTLQCGGRGSRQSTTSTTFR